MDGTDAAMILSAGCPDSPESRKRTEKSAAHSRTVGRPEQGAMTWACIARGGLRAPCVASARRRGAEEKEADQGSPLSIMSL